MSHHGSVAVRGQIRCDLATRWLREWRKIAPHLSKLAPNLSDRRVAKSELPTLGTREVKFRKAGQKKLPSVTRLFPNEAIICCLISLPKYCPGLAVQSAVTNLSLIPLFLPEGGREEGGVQTPDVDNSSSRSLHFHFLLLLLQCNVDAGLIGPFLNISPSCSPNF